MDQHDQELLDKQLRAISPSPQHTGLIATAIIAIFLVGVIAGSILTAATDSEGGVSGPAVALLDTGAPITRN